MKSSYTFKGETFTIPTLSQTRDFLEKEALDKNRKFLDRLALKREADRLTHEIEWNERNRNDRS